MGKVNISDYKNIYLKTAKKYADSLSKSCIELEINPLDEKALNQLHISSHSLKSQSQAMSYINMGNINDAIEKIARAIMEGKYVMNEKIISLLKKAIIEINLLLADIEKESKESNHNYLIKELRDIAGI